MVSYTFLLDVAIVVGGSHICIHHHEAVAAGGLGIAPSMCMPANASCTFGSARYMCRSLVLNDCTMGFITIFCCAALSVATLCRSASPSRVSINSRDVVP